jgi:DeoR family transcriptional regulator, aga operon transcriptional repressor
MRRTVGIEDEATVRGTFEFASWLQCGAMATHRPAGAALRRERMLAAIRERHFLHVRELSGRFGISEVTVRTDLDELAARGEVHRIRGGAIPRALHEPERPFEESETSFADEKVAIGRAAAELVRDGEALLVDVGTTTAAAARALAARADLENVVVFTNGLKTALELEAAHPRITVVLLGGTLRPLQHSLVEPLATLILQRIKAQTLFLGCNGVDAEGGVTNVNLPEAEVKKRMIAAAGRRVVLADGSKIGTVALVRLCDVEDVDLVITGRSADPVAVQALRDRGCEVRVVE